MKHPKSRLIHYFRICVYGGAITVDPEKTSLMAWSTLVEMLQAMESIMNGADPDEALEIERSTGPAPRGELNDMRLFLEIRGWRQRGEKWVIIEHLAAVWLADRGLPPLTEDRLKKLYRRYLRDLKKAGLNDLFQ